MEQLGGMLSCDKAGVLYNIIKSEIEPKHWFFVKNGYCIYLNREQGEFVTYINSYLFCRNKDVQILVVGNEL